MSNQVQFSKSQLIFSLITFVGRWKVVGLCLQMLVTSVLEMIGVFAIAASTKLLLDPGSSIATPEFLRPAVSLFTANADSISAEQLSIIIAISLTLALIGNLWLSYHIFRAINFNKSFLSVQLLSGYLHKPFLDITELNTDDLGKNLLVEAERISGGVLFSLINIVSSSVLTTSMLLVMIIVNPMAMLVSMALLSGTYIIMYACLAKPVAHYGQRVTVATAGRFRLAVESLRQIKLVKVDNLERTIVERFRGLSEEKAKYQSYSMLIKASPRPIVEWLVFGCGSLFLLTYRNENDISDIIPIAVVIALAGYRMLPAIQKIYAGVIEIHHSLPSLKLISDEIMFVKQSVNQPKIIGAEMEVPNIQLKGCCVTTRDGKTELLSDINLDIPAGSKIAIVGGSGAGKSTLLNLMLGLLPPCSGSIKVDGAELHKEMKRERWTRRIGYVPQSVFLIDDTIARNVAFLLEETDVDHARLAKAIDVVNLTSVVAERGDGINEIVGDNGIKLSGGQIQRLGIARALFKNPSVLFLDEATSALDGAVEKRTLENLFNYLPNTTIIAVTHRTDYLGLFDQVVVMKGGKITNLQRAANVCK